MDAPGPGNDLHKWGDLGLLAGRRVCILTFGCTYNQAESRKIENILAALGCTLLPDPGKAEALLLNTCTVIGSTERKMLRLMKKYREMPLYVTGCMPLVQMEAILSACNPVFIHPRYIDEEYGNVPSMIPRDVGIVQIGTGCPGSCTYCITRLARGPLVHFKAGGILREIQQCHDAGATEIRICAQDCSAWRGEGGENLAGLLDRVGEVPGSFLLRIGMMNPATLLPILDGMVASFRDRRIFRFVHLPVQSGSDRILQKMGRGYTVDEFLMIVRELRAKIPDIAVATDLIAGFPGEDEEDAQASAELLSAVLPAKVNITRYSPRPLTLAAKERPPPDRLRKVRSRSLQRHAEGLYHLRNGSMLGTVVEVTVTEHLKQGSVMARTPNYTGVVLNRDLPVGTRVHVRLVTDRTYFFGGDISR